MVRHGMVWYGMVRCGMVWYGWYIWNPSIVLHSLPLSYIPFHCLTFPSIVLHSLLGADTTLFGKQNTRKPESVSTFWSAGFKKVGGAKKQGCPEPVFYKPAGFINLRWPLVLALFVVFVLMFVFLFDSTAVVYDSAPVLLP